MVPGCNIRVVNYGATPLTARVQRANEHTFAILQEWLMPIYEYYCESSSDPVGCPTCNTENVKRVLSVFGFKSGGDKGAASSRMGSGASGCSGCVATNCSSCH
jgi:predicted nucleic acid-binding Zn ribbon protein